MACLLAYLVFWLVDALFRSVNVMVLCAGSLLVVVVEIKTNVLFLLKCQMSCLVNTFFYVLM